jgi:hypothetical protein
MGQRHEFRSDKERRPTPHYCAIEDAEEDGVILFLERFYPLETERWLIQQVYKINERLGQVKHAAQEEREAEERAQEMEASIQFHPSDDELVEYENEFSGEC